MPTTHDIFLSSVEGCAPNVEAFIQGQPEDMFVISQIETEAPPSFLSVQFELAYNCSVTETQAMWTGATVFAAMEALRTQGCSVSILISHTVSRDNDKWQMTAPLPSNIDLDSLSFMFTHPAMLRILTFSAMEHEPKQVRDKFGFHNQGSYSMPSRKKAPTADVMIEMEYLARSLQAYSEESYLKTAQILLDRLVQSRFGQRPILTTGEDVTPHFTRTHN